MKSCFFLFLIFFFSQPLLALEIESSAFKNNTYIPDEYTCKGEDVSHPLMWSGVSQETKSFALICDDPDAPVTTWVHWVIFNIPADRVMLHKDVERKNEIQDIGSQGKNSWGKIGYGGPCPPPGNIHRYFFKLYALDAVLDLKSGATKKDLLNAMEGHILSQAEFVGLFKN